MFKIGDKVRPVQDGVLCRSQIFTITDIYVHKDGKARIRIPMGDFFPTVFEVVQSEEELRAELGIIPAPVHPFKVGDNVVLDVNPPNGHVYTVRELVRGCDHWRVSLNDFPGSLPASYYKLATPPVNPFVETVKAEVASLGAEKTKTLEDHRKALKSVSELADHAQCLSRRIDYLAGYVKEMEQQ